jgi:hypothetical protein
MVSDHILRQFTIHHFLPILVEILLVSRLPVTRFDYIRLLRGLE